VAIRRSKNSRLQKNQKMNKLQKTTFLHVSNHQKLARQKSTKSIKTYMSFTWHQNLIRFTSLLRIIAVWILWPANQKTPKTIKFHQFLTFFIKKMTKKHEKSDQNL
jgi:hypothetical protein